MEKFIEETDMKVRIKEGRAGKPERIKVRIISLENEK